MNAIRFAIQCAAAILVAAGAPAWSQGLDADTLKAYGATYATDCKEPTAARATVFADSLVFLHGSKRIAGSNVQASYSYFGNSPPDGYRIALLAEAPDMTWIVYEDESLQYLTIDDDPKRFFRCDGTNGRATPPPAPAPRSYELTELSAQGILLDPKARSAYYKALGPLRREDWLADLDGPTSENIKVMIAGTEYVRAYACKNHDCYDNNVVLLYSAAQHLVYGKVYERGNLTLIGAPPPAVAKDLERMWRELFRSNPQSDIPK